VNILIKTFLLVYAGLFPIVNPIGGAPIFLGLTRHCLGPERNALALRVATNSLFLLLGSLLGGSYVLQFFGLTLPIVRVAGGLLVAATGWNLLKTGDEDNTRDGHRPVVPTDAFYPLTMPITVGPGSIAVAITLGSERPRGADLTYVALLGGAAIAGLIAIAVTIYVCYRFADSTVRVLGDEGTNVLVRLSAFILLCIGIAIIWDGYSELVHITG
jgi:multiple antibiotic resistance protein